MSHDESRRAHPRIRTLLEGRVVFNNRFSLLDCVVRDLSEGGARLEFPTAFELPPVFELEAPKKNLRVWARRVWSGGTQHGVSFFEPSANEQMNPLSEFKAARLQKIIEEARREIAATIGIPIEQVNLTLDLPHEKAA